MVIATATTMIVLISNFYFLTYYFFDSGSLEIVPPLRAQEGENSSTLV